MMRATLVAVPSLLAFSSLGIAQKQLPLVSSTHPGALPAASVAVLPVEVPSALSAGLESGTLEHLDAKTVLWRLRIQAPGAAQVSLEFAALQLPSSAQLWIYSPDQRHFLVPLRQRDSLTDGRLWTQSLPSDELVIELTYHPNQNTQVALALTGVSTQQPGSSSGGGGRPPGNPPNDRCTTPIQLMDGMNGPFDNIGAVDDLLWPCGGSTASDVFFTYEATCSGPVTVETCGTANFDTKLWALGGDCNGYSPLDCNDDACGTESRVSFQATLGTTYWIIAGGYNGAQGQFGLQVSCTPSNDRCHTPIQLVDGMNGPFSNVGAVDDLVWPCGGSTASDVFFTYEATCNGPVTVETCGTANFDTKIWALGGDCNGYSPLDCNDDACGLQSRVSFQATLGTTYWIIVGGFNGRQGRFDLLVSCTQSNDRCHTPIQLVEGTNGPFSNVGAVDDLVWPCGGSAASDVFFTYDATCDGPITVETCGTANFDTKLWALGGNCSGYIPLDCNDDSCGTESRVSFQATQGVTYWIIVGGYDGAQGQFGLEVSGPASNPGSFDTTTAGCAGLGITPTGGAPNIGSSVGWDLTGVGGGGTVMWIGLSQQAAPICTTGGGTCQFGTPLDIVLSTASIPPTPIPCDAALIGGQLYFQGMEFGGSSGCLIGSTPFRFRLSDTIRMTIGQR